MNIFQKTNKAGCVAADLSPDRFSVEEGTVIVPLERVPELSLVGSAVSINDDILPFPIIIARVSEDRYVAAPSRCTHKGKPLVYDHKHGLFKCCRGRGRFDIKGNTAGGPPEKSLIIFSASVKAGSIMIDLDY